LLTTQQQQGAGRCFVLTSHSMEECEALCGRVGTIVSCNVCWRYELQCMLAL
jgi:ABC-type Na+ transport system ATPase subunit NatA